MSTNDLILLSLEIAAEKAGDLTLPVYQHYFEKCPESRELMWHLDQIVQGKMLDEVIRLLMIEDHQTEECYLNFEVRTHQQSYGVRSYMYDNLFDAVLTGIREAVEDEWSSDFEGAWQERIGSLRQAIAAHTVN